MNIYSTPSIHLPMSWLVFLATGDVRHFVYGMRPLHGLLRFLHLVGMSGFLGIVMLSEVKRAGLFPEASLSSARSPMMALMNLSFAVTVVSGIALFLYDPIGMGLHTMFLPKLIIITFGFIHAFWVQRLPFVKNRMTLRRAGAIVSLVVWILVIACSTWNHVEQPLNPADVHRMDNSLDYNTLQ